MSKLAIIFLIGLILIIGVAIGQWSVERNITKTYEDGTFIGCKGVCRD